MLETILCIVFALILQRYTHIISETVSLVRMRAFQGDCLRVPR